MIFLNLGRRAVGKTTLAQYLAAQRPQQLVIDSRSQWPGSDFLDDPDETEVIERLAAGESIAIRSADLQTASDVCARAAYRYLVDTADASRELAIVIDESRLIEDLSAWSPLFRGSPIDRTTIVLTTHRPQDVPTFVRAVADYWCLFRMTQEHDLSVIEKHCGPRVVQIVIGLDPFQFVAWNDGLSTYDVHTDGSTWRTPARRLPAPTIEVSRLWR